MATDQLAALHDLQTLAQEVWVMHLEGEGRSPATIKNYLGAVRQFAEYRAAQGLPLDVTTVQPFEVSAFLAHVRNKNERGDVSARTRFAQLQQYFRYAEDFGLIDATPMAKMSPPKMLDRVPDVPDPDAVRAVLAHCAKGKTFADIRDHALFRVIRTTALREAEAASMTVDRLDIRSRTILVMGKGGVERTAYLVEPKTYSAVTKYLLARRGHKQSGESEVWLGVRGPLSRWGIYQALQRRCEQAKVSPLSVHQLRHGWADEAKRLGMSNEDMKTLGGWKTDQMLERYGRAAKSERARDALLKSGLGRDL